MALSTQNADHDEGADGEDQQADDTGHVSKGSAGVLQLDEAADVQGQE